MRTVDREPIRSRRVYYYVQEPPGSDLCNVIRVTARSWNYNCFCYESSNGVIFYQSQVQNRLYKDKKRATKRAASLNKQKAKSLRMKVKILEKHIEILESNP